MGFAALGVVLGLILIVGRIIGGDSWSNNGTLTVLGFLLIFCGSQFFAFGLLGEYIGRIFQQVRLREPWVVRAVERVGEADEHPVIESGR